MKLVRIAGLISVLLAFAAVTAFGQPVITAKSGAIVYVEGQVFLGDKQIEPSITKFTDIEEKGVVRTGEGRAEVLLTPGAVLHVGENSSVRMISKRLIDTRLELVSGSAVLDVAEMTKDNGLTVLDQAATVSISKAGHYRFDASPAKLKVFAGAADVEMNGGHIEVGGGKLLLIGSESASAEKFDKDDTDSLDNWAHRRSEMMAMANPSAAKSIYSRGYAMSASGWGWNPYYGMYTFIPRSGRFCDPFYGYCYYSPLTIERFYYTPPPPVYNAGGGGYGGYNPGYQTMGSSSSGYSGTMTAASSSVSSAPAAASAGASTAAAASSGAASAGHGGGGGGGRGH